MKVNSSSITVRIDPERSRRVNPSITINIAKSAGFCFGVRRAIELAYQAVSRGLKIYILGDIVHNEEVAKELRKAGIIKLKGLGKGKNRNLLIRAHGMSRETIRRAKELGYKIIDATCPMVKEIHKIAKTMEVKGYKIIVVGDKNHDETKGIIGHLNTKPLIIDPAKKISLPGIKRIRKASVVVQSTQNLERVLPILNYLKLQIPKLKFFNTICRPTQIKQEEIKEMPKNNEVMLIIGSKTSANTKRLYEIAKSINPKTHWVGTKKDIKRTWLKGAKSIGITAGASTPDKTIQEIVELINAHESRIAHIK
jgi:4-hydroxy-3-methylbut-2-enyl diphosphate reductase